MIHTIGDSHSDFTFRNIPNVTIHHIGPLTMRRIAFKTDTLLEETIATCNLQPGDVVVLSFGEGDCRCFIKPKLVDGLTAQAYCEDMVSHYFERLATLETNGARLATLSITPPAPYERAYLKDWPPQGSDGERAMFTKTINDLLRVGCEQRGWLHINSYAEYVGSDGMLPQEGSDGGVHIYDTAKVRVLLTKMGLLP